MPQIAIINESTAISDVDVQHMLPAFDHQWNKDLTLSGVWGRLPLHSFPKIGGSLPVTGGSYSWITAIKPRRWPTMI